MTKEKIAARAAQILTEVADSVSAKGLERLREAGIESNSLPKSGTFGKYITSGTKTEKDDFRHIRMTVDGSDDTISTSCLRIVAPKATDEPTFGKIAKEGTLKGKLYLKGKSVNAQFAKYSTAEMIAFLEGKSFTAKPLEVRSLAYNVNGYSTEAEALENLTVKTVYVVTVED